MTTDIIDQNYDDHAKQGILGINARYKFNGKEFFDNNKNKLLVLYVLDKKDYSTFINSLTYDELMEIKGNKRTRNDTSNLEKINYYLPYNNIDETKYKSYNDDIIPKDIDILLHNFTDEGLAKDKSDNGIIKKKSWLWGGKRRKTRRPTRRRKGRKTSNSKSKRRRRH